MRKRTKAIQWNRQSLMRTCDLSNRLSQGIDERLHHVAEKFDGQMDGGRLGPGHSYVCRRLSPDLCLEILLELGKPPTQRFVQLNGEKGADHRSARSRNQRRNRSNAA